MSFHAVITGATGFLGAAVVAKLLAGGARATVLLRPSSDRSRLVTMSGFESMTYSQLTDVQTANSLREKKPDIFIHCGWRGVGGKERNEAFQITDNIPAAIATVELAALTGCRQWIGLGSQAEYGNQNRRLDESTTLRPTTIYGKAKLSAGIAALALCEARKMTGTWLRVFSTYGPGDAPNWFIPYVIQEFLGGRTPKLTLCEQLWDYLYVEDAAQAIVATANGTATGVFNLGSGAARPLRDYIQAIQTELGSMPVPAYGAIPYRPDQVMHLEADISRLKAATGWEPKIGLKEGIGATVRFERTRKMDQPTRVSSL